MVFTFNDFNKVYFKNPSSSPSNAYLIHNFSEKKVKTLNWYRMCLEEGIPIDQASLLSMYLRNVEHLLEKTGKQKMPVREVLHILKSGNQTLIEPIFTELNSFCHEMSDREITLKLLQGERQQILQMSEKGSFFYIYLLLVLSILQFFFFYYTIFQVEWLGTIG